MKVEGFIGSKVIGLKVIGFIGLTITGLRGLRLGYIVEGYRLIALKVRIQGDLLDGSVAGALERRLKPVCLHKPWLGRGLCGPNGPNGRGLRRPR